MEYKPIITESEAHGLTRTKNKDYTFLITESLLYITSKYINLKKLRYATVITM